MEKLTELLNEYRKENGERSLNEFEVSQPLDSLNYLKLFIKWLIEKEKINFRKLDYNKFSGDEFCGEVPARYYLGTYIRYSFEKEILMTSVIQDEPINFLISILK